MQVSSNYLYDADTKFYTSLGEGRYLVAREKEGTEESEEKKTQDQQTQNVQQEKLSPSEKQLVSELQTRDAQVRQHEAAHKSAGAPTGAASYTYQKGPDGKMYAIGGEVDVAMKSGATPEETIQNAQAVIAAAMAPSDPSPQDHAVASSARMMMLKAQQEKNKEMQEEILKNSSPYQEAQNSLEQEKTNAIDFSA